MCRYFLCPRIYQKEIRAFIPQSTCTRMFIRAVFIIAKTRSNLDLHQHDNEQTNHVYSYDRIVFGN